MYQAAKKDVEADLKMYNQYIAYYNQLPAIISAVPGQVAEKLGKSDYTMKDLKKWKTEVEEEIQYIQNVLSLRP